MPTVIVFSGSDGDDIRWPSCGEVGPGVYLERLSLEDDYTTHFLQKLASRLSDLLKYPRTYVSFSTHPAIRLSLSEAGTIVMDLPRGYGLFCRRTESGSNIRQDRYLRGTVVSPEGPCG